MIWTVVLKDGEHFVVHGSSYERNSEVRNALRARGFEDSVVAGIRNHRALDTTRARGGRKVVDAEWVATDRRIRHREDDVFGIDPLDGRCCGSKVHRAAFHVDTDSSSSKRCG